MMMLIIDVLRRCVIVKWWNYLFFSCLWGIGLQFTDSLVASLSKRQALISSLFNPLYLINISTCSNRRNTK
ncbi:hypothetical protein C0J52_27609 [Blattella germanica]|nr:hypothetical protein C0J52_27609 [Blattella germanica]